jgi:WD40 repeat protein
LEFSPDGTLLAAGDEKRNIFSWPPGEVRVWDTAMWELRGGLEGGVGGVTGIAFSPDDRVMIVGHSDDRLDVHLTKGFRKRSGRQ